MIALCRSCGWTQHTVRISKGRRGFFENRRGANVTGNNQHGVNAGMGANVNVELVEVWETIRELVCEKCGSDERRVAVMCWCEDKMVSVPVSMVADGQTLSCGRDDCHG